MDQPKQTDEQDPFNTKRKTVYRVQGFKQLIFWPIALFLRLWFLTWRIQIDSESEKILKTTPSPRVFTIWHNRSLVYPEVYSRVANPNINYCLISASKMAAWEVAFFNLYGFKAIRGSTTRRSINALREIHQTIKAGNDITISPDGPSGPIYKPQKGAFVIANKTKTPVLFLNVNSSFSKRLKTWDRHLIPFPFAKLTVKIKLIDSKTCYKDEIFTPDRIRKECLEITEDPFQI